MISDKLIRKGFRQKLLELGFVDVDPDGQWANVSLENRNFSPKQDTDGNDIPWFRETILPSFQRQISSGYSRAQGIIQVDYFVPVNTGAYHADEMADDLKDAFIGVTLNGGIRIYRTQKLAGDQQPDWYAAAVELHYRLTNKT